MIVGFYNSFLYYEMQYSTIVEWQPDTTNPFAQLCLQCPCCFVTKEVLVASSRAEGSYFHDE
jgi:hypothetical protein